MQLCLPHSGKSFRLGLTGVPGAGKSTWIEAVGLQLVENGHRLAVLAIDPSSEVSKGSILGDKTRMERLSASENVFIRPSPAGGFLGGIAKHTRETIILCEAARSDFILIETVGVGQSETAVHHLSDFFVLLLLAGAGDELQGIKRGIMEMADAIFITKADGDNLMKAKLARVECARAIHFFPPNVPGWIPPVEICSAISGTGISEFMEVIERYKIFSNANDRYESKRKEQDQYWFRTTALEKIQNNFFAHPILRNELKKLEQQIIEKQISPHAAANSLSQFFIEALNRL